MIVTQVQGFELEVLKGLIVTLRQQRVLYVLFEFWPAGMRRNAQVDAHLVLELLNSCGYTLFDTTTLRLGSEGAPISARETFRRPSRLRENVDWFHVADRQHGARFGYWADFLAVASGPLDFDLF